MYELTLYFPEYENNELPEREYMWNVLNTLKNEESQHLIKEARKNWSVAKPSNKDDLVEITPEYLKEILETDSQKVNFYFNNTNDNIVHRGLTPFLLRKSTNLKKKVKNQNKFSTEFPAINKKNDDSDINEDEKLDKDIHHIETI